MKRFVLFQRAHIIICAQTYASARHKKSNDEKLTGKDIASVALNGMRARKKKQQQQKAAEESTIKL